mgnify:CR=1 FL=1
MHRAHALCCKSVVAAHEVLCVHAPEHPSQSLRSETETAYHPQSQLCTAAVAPHTTISANKMPHAPFPRRTAANVAYPSGVFGSKNCARLHTSSIKLSFLSRSSICGVCDLLICSSNSDTIPPIVQLSREPATTTKSGCIGIHAPWQADVPIGYRRLLPVAVHTISDVQHTLVVPASHA